jgi:hypothetical protein
LHSAGNDARDVADETVSVLRVGRRKRISGEHHAAVGRWKRGIGSEPPGRGLGREQRALVHAAVAVVVEAVANFGSAGVNLRVFVVAIRTATGDELARSDADEAVSIEVGGRAIRAGAVVRFAAIGRARVEVIAADRRRATAKHALFVHALGWGARIDHLTVERRGALVRARSFTAAARFPQRKS